MEDTMSEYIGLTLMSATTQSGESDPGAPLPQDSMRFVGRRALLAEVGDRVAAGEPLILITGQPKIGKTSLLNQMPPSLRFATLVRLTVTEIIDWCFGNNAVDLDGKLGSLISRALGQPASTTQNAGSDTQHVKRVLTIDDAEGLFKMSGTANVSNHLFGKLLSHCSTLILVGDYSLTHWLQGHGIGDTAQHLELGLLTKLDLMDIALRWLANFRDTQNPNSWRATGHMSFADPVGEHLAAGILSESIFQLTAGHPLFVQYYCSRLRLTDFGPEESADGAENAWHDDALPEASALYYSRLESSLNRDQLHALVAVARGSEWGLSDHVSSALYRYGYLDGETQRLAIPAFSRWLETNPTH